jgi:sarcosine oxidase
MIGAQTGELVPGVLASVREHRLPHEVLSADALAARYPQFRLDRSMIAVWENDAGILHPEACVRAFLGAAKAELRYGEPVREHHSACALVLTAGAGMGELVAELQPRLRVERQVVAHFAPMDEASTTAIPMSAPAARSRVTTARPTSPSCARLWSGGYRSRTASSRHARSASIPTRRIFISSSTATRPMTR